MKSKIATKYLVLMAVIRTCSNEYLKKVLEKIESGEIKNTVPVTSEDISKETYGLWLTGKKSRIGFMEPGSKNKIDDSVAGRVTSTRHHGHVVTPTLTEQEWVSILESKTPNARLCIEYPPCKVAPLAERVIYTKLRTGDWEKHIFFVRSIDAVTIYPGIRDDVRKKMGFSESSKEFHNDFNVALEKIKLLNQKVA